MQSRTIQGVPPEFREAQDLCPGTALVCMPQRTPDGAIRNFKLFRRIGPHGLTLIGERVSGSMFLRLVRQCLGRVAAEPDGRERRRQSRAAA